MGNGVTWEPEQEVEEQANMTVNGPGIQGTCWD